MLSSSQRAHLQALAHDKKPVVLLGHKGLTEAVTKEVIGALLAHELVKVKLQDKDDTEAEAKAVAKASKAELVGVVGYVAILYKKHPEKPTIKLPR